MCCCLLALCSTQIAEALAIAVCRSVDRRMGQAARRAAPRKCGRTQPGPCGRSTMCSLVTACLVGPLSSEPSRDPLLWLSWPRRAVGRDRVCRMSVGYPVALRCASRCTPDTGVCVLSVSLSGKVTLFVSFSVRAGRAAVAGAPILVGPIDMTTKFRAPVAQFVRGTVYLPHPHIGVCEARQVDDPLDQPER